VVAGIVRSLSSARFWPLLRLVLDRQWCRGYRRGAAIISPCHGAPRKAMVVMWCCFSGVLEACKDGKVERKQKQKFKLKALAIKMAQIHFRRSPGIGPV